MAKGSRRFEIVSHLRIKEREPEAGGLDEPTNPCSKRRGAGAELLRQPWESRFAPRVPSYGPTLQRRA